MTEWNNDQQQGLNGEQPSVPPTYEPPTEQLPAQSPVQEEQPVYQPPVQEEQPVYQPPAYQPPVYQAPTYTPPSYTSQPMYTPPERNKGDRVPIIVLSILCVLSVLITCGVTVMFMLSDTNGDDAAPQNTATTIRGDLKDTKPTDAPNAETGTAANPNAPGMNIQQPPSIEGASAEADGGLLTSEIVANNLDSTVVLTMYQKYSYYDYGGFYGGYYDYYGGYNSGYESDSDLVEAGGATGIIYSADGYIITNSHCVYNEETGRVYDRLVVTLYNGDEYEAAVAGYDPTTDLAVIKIDAKGLTPATFGDSSALQLGERIITLGNSGGLEWSASLGIVSGLARDVYDDTGYAIKCLQVDAIINPGSSGGPLFNKYGQVVGINSAKIVSEGYEGLGFSIPINDAKSVIEDLAKYGYVRNRVSLGIAGYTVTSIGYEGFFIEQINKGSSLEGTEAKVGDIITHVNGKRVMDYAEMRAQLTSYNVGDEIELSLIRLDRETRTIEDFTIKVVLQESR